jgi:phage shock protein PspC (stress-responsive transcriptional regulator)
MTDPTTQQTDQPATQPTAPPTVAPDSPNADQQYASSARLPRRLVRRTDDKMLGGVCSGLAAHFALDPTLVRILTVLVTVLGFGSVVIVYVLAWLIVPADTDPRVSGWSTAVTPPPPAAPPTA